MRDTDDASPGECRAGGGIPTDLAEYLNLSQQAIVALLVSGLLDDLQISLALSTGAIAQHAAKVKHSSYDARHLDGDFLASLLVLPALDHREA